MEVPTPSSAVMAGPTNSLKIKKLLKNLAISQIVFGNLCIFIEAMRIIFVLYTYGEGIWGGIFVLVCGILGCCVGKSNGSRCVLIATLVMAVIAAAVQPIMMLFSMVMAVTYHHYYVSF